MYRPLCTGLDVQICMYGLVGAVLYVQTCMYRLVGTDLYVQSRMYGLVLTDPCVQTYKHARKHVLFAAVGEGK